jgi:hypothetical protein
MGYPSRVNRLRRESSTPRANRRAQPNGRGRLALERLEGESIPRTPERVTSNSAQGSLSSASMRLKVASLRANSVPRALFEAPPMSSDTSQFLEVDYQYGYRCWRDARNPGSLSDRDGPHCA